MANWNTLKTAVAGIINTNGNQAITGQLLQNVLNNIITSVGENATFVGIATPTTTPGAPEGPIFYLASRPGVYSNFNGLDLSNLSGFAIIQYKNNTWVSHIITTYTIYNKVRVTASVYGKGTGAGQNVFYFSKVFLKKGQQGKLHFKTDGAVSNVSCYLTKNSYNLNDGYVAIGDENYKAQLSPNSDLIIPFTAEDDGYVMFNTLAKSGVQVSCDIYTDLATAVTELQTSLESLREDVAKNTEASKIATNYKLISFGASRNVQPFLGQSEVGTWASVVHGAAVQDVNALYVIKGNDVKATSQLVFNLYEGKGRAYDECFDTLLDTIIISVDKYNAIPSGDIVKIALSKQIEFLPEKYYTLECSVGSQGGIRLGACDAKGANNFILASYFRTPTGTAWNVVHTASGGSRNYGLLWGVYLGEGKSVNPDTDHQSKLHMNALSASLKMIEANKKEAEDIREVITPSVPLHLNHYSLLGKVNTVESSAAADYTFEFNFTDFYFKKGHAYRLRFSSTDITKVKKFSPYNDAVKNNYTPGYIPLVSPETYTNPTEDIVFDYVADFDGYLMYNVKVLAGYTLDVDVYELALRSDIDIKRVETHELAGANDTVEDTDSHTKINNVHFAAKMYANKTYYIRLSQNKTGYLKSLSLYVLYKHASLDEGYETIREGSATNLKEQSYIEYTPKKDGYLMANTYATTAKKITIILCDNVFPESANEKQDILSLKNRVKTVIANSTGKFPCIKGQLADTYLTLSGDSTFAFQNVYNSDKLGVSAVPPTCDRTANANKLWNALKWGNAIYRRFDYGKASLLSGYDNSFTDDSKAAFTETGAFKTEYIGASMRAVAGNSTTNYQTTTKVDLSSFPYQFDNSEDSWWQRNIPKRFSNSANASIKFVIPAGYSKFDFIFHAHLYGDNVTITTNRGNGIVKLNTKPNDWGNAVEANGAVKDLSMANYSDGTGRKEGNDAFGIPNARLYFKIENTSSNTEVTITKSSNTSKYLIYWGITYWGTTALPYALHINNMAVGGYGQGNIYALRKSMFQFIHSDAVIMEMCYNDLASKNLALSGMSSEMLKLKEFFTSIGLSLDKIGVWVPHCGVTVNNEAPDVIQINTQGAEKIALDLGYTFLVNIKKICDDTNEVYYSMSAGDFMEMLGGDGIHLGQNGYDLYQAAWESLR